MVQYACDTNLILLSSRHMLPGTGLFLPFGKNASPILALFQVTEICVAANGVVRFSVARLQLCHFFIFGGKSMKKLITLLLVLVIALSLEACGGEASANEIDGKYYVSKWTFQDVTYDADDMFDGSFFSVIKIPNQNGDYWTYEMSLNFTDTSNLVERDSTSGNMVVYEEKGNQTIYKCWINSHSGTILKMKEHDFFLISYDAVNDAIDLLDGNTSMLLFTKETVEQSIVPNQDLQEVVETEESSEDITSVDSNNQNIHPTSEKMTMNEAVLILLSDNADKAKMLEAQKCIVSYADGLKVLDSAAISNYLDGYIMEISFQGFTPIDNYLFP